ncbi:MAG: hypothetical protein OHK0039_00030 [Bacteroidia bacterium]
MTRIHLTGYLLLGLSLTLFLFLLRQPPWAMSFVSLDLPSLFWVIFLISVAYFIAILTVHTRQHGFRKLGQGDEANFAIALSLFSLSAHALNYGTNIRVFSPYADWMVGYVVLMHVALLLLPYRQRLPQVLRYGAYFIAGAGCLLALYLTIFLGPLILVAFPAALLFGLSMHATVPLWFLIEYARLPWRMETTRPARLAFWSGMLLPVLVLTGFMTHWREIQRDIEAVRSNYTQHADAMQVPEWVYLSQYLPEGMLSETVIMSEALAQESYWTGGNSLFGGGSSEFVRHDPLAVVANLLYGPLEFGNETLIHLLESRYDARHMTHRRLWRGGDLRTRSVHTRVDLHPGHRLAYLEHDITVENTDADTASQQEAIFTFHLPEGAAVTGLSLWVEGRERPARLTTRRLADSAYVQIVGRERRDPALLHWQEGNRVTVTVFPCTPSEARRLRVGYSLPLTLEDERLWLRNVWFDGPAPEGADGLVVMHVHGAATQQDWRLPIAWRRQDDGSYRYQGDYHPDWEVGLSAPAIDSTPFRMDSLLYTARPLELQSLPLDIREVEIDLNWAWSLPQWQAVLDRLGDLPVYVRTHERVRVTPDNRLALYQQLSRRHFTLFPFHQLSDPAHTLVVGKGTARSPLLQDLDGTILASELGAYLSRQTAPACYWVLGETLSPYQRSLRELRAVHFGTGDLAGLEQVLAQGSFPVWSESPGRVALAGAGMAIEVTAANGGTGAAPDHLARLFGYQRVLGVIGQQYFDRERLEAAWLREAERYFVVSPVSSLIVLETDGDYDRFGIEANDEGLGQALQTPPIVPGEGGAVPEPHEWALIILTATMLLVAAWRQRTRLVWR